MIKHLDISFEEIDSAAGLQEEDSKLLEMAQQAAASAYAPYSEFHVGAAVMLEDGTVITGNNQENAAFPSGLCAERVAIFSSLSMFPLKKINTIAITAYSNEMEVDFPVTPCGSCRQVIAETEKRQGRRIRVIMAGKTGKVIITSGIENLLPFVFNPGSLKK